MGTKSSSVNSEDEDSPNLGFLGGVSSIPVDLCSSFFFVEPLFFHIVQSFLQLFAQTILQIENV